MLRLAALVCALLAGPVAAAVAPKPAAVRSYERGARELEFARYSEATTALEAAIALDPIESPQPVARPSGMNFEPYLPHLALGIARCENGDLAGAVASWAESDRQGAALSSRGAARLLQRREECRGRRGESLLAAQRALEVASAPAADAAPGAPAPAESRQPERVPLAATPPTPEPVEQREPLAAAPPPAVVAAPPEALLRAAQELFDGRPGAAYTILERFSSESSRARGQAHLLRAAACFELAHLGPDSTVDWLARAGAERLAAIAAAPALVPDRRYFAPGFVAFFGDGADPKPLPDLLAH